MEIINIKMGEFLLLKTISVIQYKEQEISYDIKDNTDKILHVILRFVKNPQKEGAGFDTKVGEDANTCIIEFFNISGIGGTTTEPTEIAEYDTDKKKLYLAVDLKPMKSGSVREILLNFYTKDTNNGSGD